MSQTAGTSTWRPKSISQESRKVFVGASLLQSPGTPCTLENPHVWVLETVEVPVVLTHTHTDTERHTHAHAHTYLSTSHQLIGCLSPRLGPEEFAATPSLDKEVHLKSGVHMYVYVYIHACMHACRAIPEETCSHSPSGNRNVVHASPRRLRLYTTRHTKCCSLQRAPHNQNSN